MKGKLIYNIISVAYLYVRFCPLTFLPPIIHSAYTLQKLVKSQDQTRSQECSQSVPWAIHPYCLLGSALAEHWSQEGAGASVQTLDAPKWGTDILTTGTNARANIQIPGTPKWGSGIISTTPNACFSSIPEFVTSSSLLIYSVNHRNHVNETLSSDSLKNAFSSLCHEISQWSKLILE